MTKHTALPWILNTRDGKIPAIREIKSAYGEASRYEATIITEGEPPFNLVCRLNFGYGKPEDQANARFIVTACNCHEKLLEALAEHSLYYLDPDGNELFDQPLNWEAMLLQEIRKAEETQ